MKVKEESGKVGLKLNIQKTKIMASGANTSWQIDGETVETVSDFILGGSKITAVSDYNHEIKRHLLPGRKVMTNLDSILKSRDVTFPTKFRLVEAMVFPVVMYGCESWTIKKAEPQRIDSFELWCWRRLLRLSWTARKSSPVNPKGNQPWIFIGRTDAEVEAPILWSPDTKNWLIRKDPDAGKDWRQEEKGTTEDEMIGWHHWLNGDEFEQALEVGDEHRSVVCCSPWGRKESDRTEQVNLTDLTLGSSHDLPNSLALSLPFSLSFIIIPLHLWPYLFPSPSHSSSSLCTTFLSYPKQARLVLISWPLHLSLFQLEILFPDLWMTNFLSFRPKS